MATPVPPPSAAYEQELALLTAIAELAREQREALEQGRMDVGEQIMARRADLLARLQALPPPDGAERPGLRQLVQTIRELDAESATLLRARIEELANEAVRLAREEEAAAAYLQEAGRGVTNFSRKM